ncbi:MAG: pyridoxal phosphate-dependent aminotransferase [Planctomycetota bacterium]|nr:pyridoxal phosphate-dependent aminotransferase [Planctomycetota bacterium]
MNERATRLQGETAFEVLARAQELEAAGRTIIHLEIGQPDFPTPEHIREAAVEALRAGKTGYGPTPGIPELRQAIAEHAGKLRGVPLVAEQIIVTPGAKPLLFYAINALAGKGDEVIYPDPGFPMYASIIAHSGALPVPLPLLEENDFRFDPEHFRQLVTDRTVLVIINSPQNPTGGVLTRQDLEIIAEEARRRDFLVLSDEVYKHFIYDDCVFESILSLPGMAERTILVDGFSKSYSMTGWRLGFAALPRALVETFDLYSVNIVSCTCTFNQYGALAALQGTQDPVQEMVDEFRRRRDFLVEGLNRLPGWRCTRPRGAFYVFPCVRDAGIPSPELADRLLDEAGVATVPGNSFGLTGDGYLRLSYANSLENLGVALRRTEEFFAKERPRSGP